MSEPVLVRREDHEHHAQVVLARGRGNALEPAGLGQLAAVFGDLRRRGAPPVVLAAEGRSFCTGLDLDHAAGLDRRGMRELMEAFHVGLAACALYPGPVVAALHGHALAGGALLALAADRRVMARGRARFGVHGIGLGVSYPQVAVEIVRQRLGRAGAEELLYDGRLLHADEARERGWVDEVVAPEDLLGCAAQWAGLHPPAGLPVRHVDAEAIDRPLAEALAAIDRAEMEAWLDQWFSPSTQSRVGRAREALREGVREKVRDGDASGPAPAHPHRHPGGRS